jgi:hypothetical protein
MRYLFSLFFILMFCSRLFAYEHEFVVTDVASDESIQIQRLDKQIQLFPGDVLAVFSHETKKVLGYARVDSITDHSDLFIAIVETHNKNGIIRAENYLKKLDLTKTANDIPARYDLIYKEGSKTAAKYRPLVYAGLIHGMTAASLSKKEFLVGPSILAYGITSNVQIDLNLASTLFGVTNIGLKNKFIDNDDFELSIENGFQYYSSSHNKFSYQFTGYLDMASNSNVKSFAKFKVFTKKPQDQSINNNEEYQRDLNFELQLAYGYLFSNWNQMIFGPKVDVNKKRVGGIVGYYMIEKNFSTMFGVSSNDFSEFRLGKQGYLLNLDFWWRF